MGPTRSRVSELLGLAGKAWLALVPGLIFGVVAVVQAVQGSERSAYFWAMLAALTVVVVFGVVAYRALGERDKALGGSPIVRLERLAAEISVIRREHAANPTLHSGDVNGWIARVIAELRESAPAFLPYFRTNPTTPPQPGQSHVDWLAEYSEVQMAHILSRLRAGHYSP